MLESKVYVAACADTGLVKVGVSNDPVKRIMQLNTVEKTCLTVSYATRFCKNARDIEKMVLLHFRDKKEAREFLSASLSDVVDEVKNRYMKYATFSHDDWDCERSIFAANEIDRMRKEVNDYRKRITVSGDVYEKFQDFVVNQKADDFESGRVVRSKTEIISDIIESYIDSKQENQNEPR